MNYNLIRDCDVANGTGVRVSLFVSGCTHHCKGCFNEIAWDFNYGQTFTDKTVDEILKLLDKPYIAGLSILGGEPLEAENCPSVAHLIQVVRNTLPNKDIWLWTGFYLSDLKLNKDINYIINNVDYIVEGPFIEEQKDLSLAFRGSRNQNIIRIKKDEKV